MALIAISIGLVGAFFLVAENLRGVVETVRDESAVTVFLKPGVTDADRADLERVARDSRLVAKTKRVTPGAGARTVLGLVALAGARGATPPTNPFPSRSSSSSALRRPPRRSPGS